MLTQLLPLHFNLNYLFDLAERFSKQEGTAFLYSGGQLDSARKSFLFLFPYEKILLDAAPGCWEALQRQLDLSSPFPEWVGYLGYEMGCFSDQDVKIPCFQAQIPGGLFYRCACVIVYDHTKQEALLHTSKEHLPSRYQGLAWIEEEGMHTTLHTSSFHLVKQSDTLESYSEKVLEAQEWIRSGEIYQVNLSQEFVLKGTTSPFAYFRKVSGINPAPFSAFLHCGDFSIVSSSPERLLRKQGDYLETRPIKGTAPRGKSKEEDHVQRQYLLTSEKERAELLMITDLMRNDLGRISEPGSIHVKELWRLEEYTNVFHLVSIIEGKAMGALHPVEILKTIFPGGSITGCPKLRAMEAIATLEKRPRGLYTGSIGYFSGSNFDFNIAIRTLVVHPDTLQIQLGGAIVIDSDPLKEFEETLHKGRSLFTVLGIGDRLKREE